jgi:hypothetical protein
MGPRAYIDTRTALFASIGLLKRSGTSIANRTSTQLVLSVADHSPIGIPFFVPPSVLAASEITSFRHLDNNSRGIEDKAVVGAGTVCSSNHIFRYWRYSSSALGSSIMNLTMYCSPLIIKVVRGRLRHSYSTCLIERPSH